MKEKTTAPTIEEKDLTVSGKILSVGNLTVDEKAVKSRRLKGFANKATIDRGGDLVLPSAFNSSKEKFMSLNPVAFYNHDWETPIGQVTTYDVRTDGLYVEIDLSSGFAEADKAWTLAQKGLVKTFSIGFIPKDVDYDDETGVRIIKDLELLEISIVTIPMNAESTFVLSKGQIAGIMCGAKDGKDAQVTYKQLIELDKAKQDHDAPNEVEAVEETTPATPEVEAKALPEESKQWISISDAAQCDGCEQQVSKAINTQTDPCGKEHYLCFDCFVEDHDEFYKSSSALTHLTGVIESLTEERDELLETFDIANKELSAYKAKTKELLEIVDAIKSKFVNQVAELVIKISKNYI